MDLSFYLMVFLDFDKFYLIFNYLLKEFVRWCDFNIPFK